MGEARRRKLAGDMPKVKRGAAKSKTKVGIVGSRRRMPLGLLMALAMMSKTPKLPKL